MDFAGVRVLTAFDTPSIQKSVGEALRGAGFSSVVDAPTFAKLEETLGRTLLDLVIVSDKVESRAVAPLLRATRHGTLGLHPFPVVVALMAPPADERLKPLIDAGPDDVLLLPASPPQILSRVTALALTRKPFIVTDDYIGPDRRRNARAGAEHLVDVPNPLKARASGIGGAAYRDQIIAATRAMDRHILDRAVVQLRWQGQTLSRAEQSGAAERGRDIAAGIESIASGAMRRLARRGADALKDLAASLAQEARALAGNDGETKPAAVCRLCSDLVAGLSRHLEEAGDSPA